VPVTAPRMIEPLVGLHGGIVVRTKTDPRDLMHLCSGEPGREGRVDFAGDDAGGFIFPEFQPTFDAMFAFGKLLEMLAITDLDISELFAELPQVFMARQEVRCPWDLKGRVMRVLAQEADAAAKNDGRRVQLIDGIKLFSGDDWVLILPDSSEPVFHVYAEGGSKEAADKLLCRYVEKIEAVRG